MVVVSSVDGLYSTTGCLATPTTVRLFRPLLATSWPLVCRSGAFLLCVGHHHLLVRPVSSWPPVLAEIRRMAALFSHQYSAIYPIVLPASILDVSNRCSIGCHGCVSVFGSFWPFWPYLFVRLCNHSIVAFPAFTQSPCPACPSSVFFFVSVALLVSMSPTLRAQTFFSFVRPVLCPSLSGHGSASVAVSIFFIWLSMSGASGRVFPVLSVFLTVNVWSASTSPSLSRLALLC